MDTGIEAIKERMTFAELARRLGVTRSALQQWDRVPAERVLDVERATGIPRKTLRPDLFDGMEAAK